jgi:hypothetical protein
MVVGMTGVVSAAHAANGANVVQNQKWTSFSVCTREDGGTWEDALKEVEVKDDDGNFLRYQTYGQDYATYGYIAAGSTASSFDFYVKNSGWDGEYNPKGDLVGNNPWGMTATMTGIPVELGRYYTISFQIKSTLKTTKTVEDSTTGEKVEEPVTTKHILFKAYDPNSNGEPSVAFTKISGATSAGYIVLDSTQDWQTVTATIKIPDTNKLYGVGNTLGIKFAMGAFLQDYKDEIGMSGYVYVKDFKITAGTQYTVKYTDPVSKKSVSSYVNAGAKATSKAFERKGYTLSGYKNAATGATYNFNSAVNSNLNLTAVWTKTKAPAKTKVTAKCTAKKKVAVTLKKVSNASGYEIQYSYKKNMKGAKKVTTSKVKYTLKKLKSGSFVYIKARAFTYDSARNEVYSKLSARKKVYVK